MALLFADPGGAFYATTAQAVSGYYAALSATIATTGLPAGNVEPTALKNVGVNGASISVPQTSGPYTIGMRVCLTSTFSEQEICRFRDTGTGVQTSFWTEANGTIKAYRGGSTLIGTSSSAVTLSQNVWAYLELQLSIDATAGAIGVAINGTNVLQTTGNTKGQSSSDIGSINFGSNLNNYIQDIYVIDSTGSYNNTYLGDCEMPVSLAKANGTYTDWTANGAATIYQSVNAATPADSTVFASDSTPGDRMSVAYPSTALTSNIVGVCHVSRMNKSTSGTRTVSQVVTNNGVDQVASAVSLATSYTYYLQVSETDPNTGAPWTQAGFNTIQTGLITES